MLHRLRGKRSRRRRSESSTRRLGRRPTFPLLRCPHQRPPPPRLWFIDHRGHFLGSACFGSTAVFFFFSPTIFFLILLRRTITRIIMKPEPGSMRRSPLQPSDRFVSAQSCLFKLSAGRSRAQGSAGAFSGRCSGPLQGPSVRARSWCWDPGRGGRGCGGWEAPHRCADGGEEVGTKTTAHGSSVNGPHATRGR